MFSKATYNFVRQIDHEGSLIPVSSVKNSHKLVPMALVVKRKRYFWQKPRYHPTDFTLSDLLLGDEVLSPVVSCKDNFLGFKGTYRDKVSASLDTEAGPVSVTLEGQGSSMLRSCFGKLKMEELVITKLLNDSRNRSVDMQHVLVQQIEKRAEVLAVVKERIFTTSPCSVTQTQKQQCTLKGVLGLLSLLGNFVKVCVKDSNNISMDSVVSLEIPSGTVIAYSVRELEIKKDGHYVICVQPNTNGGFEDDSVKESSSSDFHMDSIDGTCNGSKFQVPSVAAQDGFHETDLSPLADLPQITRCALIKKLQQVLEERSTLSHLQYVLEELCSCETADEDVTEEKFDSLTKPSIPDQLGLDRVTEGGVTAELKAVHLLVSAMEELPDETLNLLSQSRPDFLQAFDKLMSGFNESSERLSVHSLPILLQDNQAFQQAEQLLSSIGVTLRRDAEELRMEMGSGESVLTLVLSLSVHGLALLSTGLQ
ncbi:gasdermin-E-like [Cololabis saira]|uniref:gasdermin-E-like n=1 Tax=Cololabis saira TaxID=129043 RepID=UPI002AD271D4|nr:gasdermin-E-like [Cololabis saira]